MSQASLISAIFVSYNTADMTCQAIDTLLTHADGQAIEIIVVDNASKDDTVARLQADYPQVRVVANKVNSGFGAANNQGMAIASGDVFLLINTDAFVFEGAVQAMVARLLAEPKLGMVGPKLLNADGSIQQSCFGFPTPRRAWIENMGLDRLTRMGQFAHDQAAEVDFVSGACMLLKREVYEQVGGFDEQFFMYAEESDWQCRISNAGWHIGFEPSAIVTHLGGGSQKAGSINPEFFRSLDRYVLKHHGRLGVWSLRLAMGIGAVIRLPLRWVLAQRSELHAAKLRLNWFIFQRCLLGDAVAVAALESKS